MASKRNLSPGSEDVDDDLVEGRPYWREVHKDDLGKIELSCYGLFLRLRQVRLRFGRHLDYGYRVPHIACLGKDIEGCEGELHLGAGRGEAVENIPALTRPEEALPYKTTKERERNPSHPPRARPAGFLKIGAVKQA